MGHIVVAAPRTRDWPLMGPLVRRLLQRGHRAAALALDPLDRVFFRRQGLPTVQLRPGDRPSVLSPLEDVLPFDVAELARRDLALHGPPMDGHGAARFAGRARARLLAVSGAVRRYFELERPDLVLIHDRRDGLARMVHSFAVELGCDTLHTGPGVLPGTMQWDAEGIDGDASNCFRSQRTLRDRPGDEAFVAAALAGFLGLASAPPVAPRPVRPPDLFDRLGAAWTLARRGEWRRSLASLDDWRDALRPRRPEAGPGPDEDRVLDVTDVLALLGERPHICVLLQRPDDSRIRLDCDEPLRPERLLRAVVLAAAGLPTPPRVVAVSTEPLPPLGPVRSGAVDVIRVHGTIAASHALPTALVTVTANHPLGCASILSGTPTLHVGNAVWALPGVSHRTTLDALEHDLPAVLSSGADDDKDLRDRLLTRLLAYEHVWCDPCGPDANGLRGLVGDIEARVDARRPAALPLRYRAGPIWPLAVGTQRRSG